MSSPAPQAAGASAAAKKRPVPAILGAVLVVLGGGGYVAWSGFAAPKAPKTTSVAPAERQPGVVAIDPFILNLADPTGDRYLRLNVRLVLDDEELAKRMKEGLPQVKLRDRLLAVLSKKRASEVVTVEGKERLRAELVAAMEELLGEPPFHDAQGAAQRAHARDVLFTEFLVQ